jgi:hypothetical protein
MMSVSVDLTLEQLADIISRLTAEERETLEILLDPELAREMINRGNEYEELKLKGQLLTLEELREQFKEVE